MIGDNDEPPFRDDDRQGPGDGSNSSPDYEVGYRKPPKSGQFKPGQSGNPRGRKKKQPTIADRLNKELSRKVTVTEHGKRKTVTKLELAFMALTNLAAKGDMKAISFVINLLNTQAAETFPALNTDVMTPEDLAILEGYLGGMDIGEPYVAPSPNHDSQGQDDAGVSQ